MSLNTNHRSHKPLVECLNALFSMSADFITLPRCNSKITYHNVLFPQNVIKKNFSDHLSSLHFYSVTGDINTKDNFNTLEDQYFFPFISQEIVNIYNNDHISLNKQVVLVRDRYQALRLQQFLKKLKIPSITRTIT